MYPTRVGLAAPQRVPAAAVAHNRAPAGTVASAILQLQGAVGNRATTAFLKGSRPLPVVVQRVLVNAAPAWDPVDAATGQGTHVKAIVGPGVAYGSGPKQNVANFRPYAYTSMFSDATKQANYCQGHLLNDNLGGPGDPAVPHAAENLTAFPQKPTNTDHLQVVERLVKNATSAGQWIEYEVRVGYGTDSMPRLMKRLGVAGAAFDNAYQANTGLDHTVARFSYASRLQVDWQELDYAASPNNANAVPLVGGLSGQASFTIPSPMTFTANDAVEYPGGVPNSFYGKSFRHMTHFKDVHSWDKTVGGAAQPVGRPHVMPQRWRGIKRARANQPVKPGRNAAYQAGYDHYNEGVAASRLGTAPVIRYGRGYTMGYQDYSAGIAYAHTHPIGTVPAVHAESLAHAEYWAGKALALTLPLTTPPVNNKAHIAGHADYWAGVEHAHTNLLNVPPVGNLAKIDGHTDYWSGVTHALTTPPNQVPVGNLAKAGGYTEYWEGVEAALASLTAVLAPDSTLGRTQGHKDFAAGVAYARANPRTAVPAPDNLAKTGAFTDYWLGADHAKANDRTVAFPKQNSAAFEGAADYWAGVDVARSNLPALQGAGPAAGAKAEGFAGYKEGVEAYKAAQNKPASKAGILGWDDAEAGSAEAAGASGGPKAPTQTHSGFQSGFYHTAGTVLAASGQAAPSGGLAEGVAAGGHAKYLGGAQAAKAGTAVTDRAGMKGHADYTAGISHAQANPRTNPPGAENVTRAGAFKDYWLGSDHARANERNVAYPAQNAAAAAGAADFWKGVDTARSNLATLEGPAPAGGAQSEGFAGYREGVELSKAAQGRPGFPSAGLGWDDAESGSADAAGFIPGADVAPKQSTGGYQSGYFDVVGAILAAAGKDAPSGGPAEKVAAAAHARYLGGAEAAHTGAVATHRAGLQGHADYLAGVAHAQSHPRTGLPGPENLAKTAAFTEYWKGADHAAANSRDVAYPSQSTSASSGIADFWAGVDIARSTLAALEGAAPTAGAQIEGFARYREGVDSHTAGRGRPACPAAALGWDDAEAGAAQAAAYDKDAVNAPSQTFGGYQSGYYNSVGVILAATEQPAPGGGVAENIAARGHAGYLEGMKAAKAAAAATSRAGLQGHTDYTAGIAHAEANPRGASPAPGSLAKTTGFNEYWAGADHALGNLRTSPYPEQSAAAAKGVADFWSGVDQARSDLANLEGAAPTAGAGSEGFAEYREGVDAHRNAQPRPSAPARALGWDDAEAGAADSAGYVAGTEPAPLQTAGGYLSGFYHSVGVIMAAANLGAPSGGLAANVAARGHAGYLGGMQAAQTGAGAAGRAGLMGHADYTAGVNHARGNARGAAPAPGNLARTNAFNEYWAGADHAKVNVRNTPHPAPSAATDAGVSDYWTGVDHAVAQAQGGGVPAGAAGLGATDYWSGEQLALGNRLAGVAGGSALSFNAFWNGYAHARLNLVNLQGAPPPGRVEALGFTTYLQGVQESELRHVNQAGNPAFSVGWSDFNAGYNAVRNGNVNPLITDSGYLYAVARTQPPITKRRTGGGGEPPVKKIKT